MKKIIKRKAKILGVIILGLYMMGLVLANGLSIEGDNTFTINKTYNTDVYLSFSIRNDEPFDFYNISFEDNPHISISEIPILASGETKNITAIIRGNDNIHSDFKLYGYYLASLGVLNNTHQVDISYDDGLSSCDFSIIRGDSVQWTNLETVESKTVKLKNVETGNYFQDIAANHSSLQVFDSILTLPFQFIDRTGYARQSCVLTVLNDNGNINNPELDTSINIDLNVVYPDTTLELFTLNTNYSMKFFEKKEDIFSIRNSGTEIAKNVNLDAEWFSFTVNNFDLLPGESKNIGYTIDPIIYNSNQTDQTYLQQLDLTGNFLTISRDFTIFIEYAEFVENEEENSTTLKDYICENYPEFCEPQVIYKYIDSGDAEINITTTENRVNALYDLFYDDLDSRALDQKRELALRDAMNATLSKIANDTKHTNDGVSGMDEKISTSNSIWGFTAVIVGMALIGGMLIVILFKYKEKYQNNIWSRYG